MARGRDEKLGGHAARCLGVALLLALVWAAEAPAQQAAPGATHAAKGATDDAAGDAGHPATNPGVGAAGAETQHHTASRADGEHLKGAKGGKGDRPAKVGQGTRDGVKFGAKQDGKAGPTNLDTLDIAVPRRRPKVSARDRLFKKIEAVKAAHANPRRITAPVMAPVLPGGPVRNAIGVIDTGTRWMPGGPRQGPGQAGIITRPVASGGDGRNGKLNPAPNTVRLPLGQTAAVVTAPPRGLVNGTTVVHVGAGPATLGGPARVTTGINGTTLKLKH